MQKFIQNPLEKIPPKRLSAITHELARKALSGEWGKSLSDLELVLDSKYKNESLILQYAHCIKLIAEKAPIRIFPYELIIGSATLIDATFNKIPVKSPRLQGVSHTTIDFNKALKIGYNGLRKQIAERSARNDLNKSGLDLLKSMNICLNAANIWKRRYIKKIKELILQSSGELKKHYQKVYHNIKNVPNKPPKTFYEAVQSLWFVYCFQRLCGNWSGIGRIDQMLGPYLENDLKNGTINKDEAREILAHFWIKGSEWACIYHSEIQDNKGSGDAQYFQNIILAGIDSNNIEVLNNVTYLVLDIIEELHISDFPISVRVNRSTPFNLFKRIAEVQCLGGGIVGIYNESQNIQSLIDYGFPLEDARNFTNDGCWEIIIPGKTNFTYMPMDCLRLLHQVFKKKSVNNVETFEDLFGLFKEKLRKEIKKFNKMADLYGSSGYPAALISLFVDDCIEKARGYFDNGCRYTIFAPHFGGIQDTGNCLYIIKKIVFEEKKISLKHLLNSINNNWEDDEILRLNIKNKYLLYGNDNPEVDSIVKNVLDIFIDLSNEISKRNGILRPPGVSTFGRQVTWAEKRGATVMGTLKGEYLSSNFSPTPGTDYQGPTSVIKSHCSLNLKRLVNGTSLELKIHPSSVKGENGLIALIALMEAFIELGGIFMVIDIIDSQMLKEAQKRPDNYFNLSVRIAGWSARFVTLSNEFQNMIIQRTEQRI